MGNCLKTQLKNVVNNDNLMPLGAIIVTTPVQASGVVAINATDGKILDITMLSDGVNITAVNTSQGKNTLVDNKHVKIAHLDESFSGTNRFVVDAPENSTVNILIKEKYDIEKIYIKNVNNGLSELKYSDMMKAIYIEYSDDNIITSIFKNMSLIETVEIGGVIKGSLSDFSGKANLKNLSLNCSTDSELTGDISVIGDCTSIKKLLLGSSREISGSIESFVAAQKDIGRTTLTEANKIDLGTPDAWLVTFNNEVLHSNSRVYLYWDENNIYCG